MPEVELRCSLFRLGDAAASGFVLLGFILLLALTGVSNRNACRVGLASIAIGLAITTAHRIEYFDTSIRAFLADTGTVCDLARAFRKVAKLPFLAFDSSYSPAHTPLLAGSLVIDGHGGRRRQARVAIGPAIASTYGSEFTCTGCRDGFTYALGIGDLALTFSQIAVLSRGAGDAGNASANVLRREIA